MSVKDTNQIYIPARPLLGQRTSQHNISSNNFDLFPHYYMTWIFSWCHIWLITWIGFLFFLFFLLIISDGLSIRNLGFGFWKYYRIEKWVYDKLNKDFLHFLPNFCHIWWLSNVEYAKGVAELWKIIKYAKILAKNEEKPCTTCLFNPFLGWFQVPQKPRRNLI